MFEMSIRYSRYQVNNWNLKQEQRPGAESRGLASRYRFGVSQHMNRTYSKENEKDLLRNE